MEERLTIQNPIGQKIVGVINQPKENGSFPAIIIVHGFKGFKEQLHFVYLSEELSKLGFLVCRFDFTNGIGESDGDIYNITVGHYIKDLEAVYSYVQFLEKVKKNEIVIYGASLGGTVALLFASNHPDIKGLILQEPAIESSLSFGPYMDVAKWREQGYWIFRSYTKGIDCKVSYQFYEERQAHNIFEAAQKIKVPTLILHNPKAEDLPYIYSEKIIKQLPHGSKLYPLDGIPHTPKEKEHLRRIKLAIIDWLLQSMKT